MEFPFFKATLQSGLRIATSGSTSRVVGHPYPGSDPANPSGVFAEWHWDGAQLTARVDRLGFYSLYYYANENEVMVSPSPLQLIAQGAPAELDDAALGIFFQIGFFIREDTPFKQIKILPPRGKLVWRPGSVSVTGGIEVAREQPMSKDDAVDGFIAHFRTAMRRAMDSCPAPIVHPLSGGRDSRHILLEMHAQNRLPSRCITFNSRPGALNAEATAAKAIADAVGAKHEVLVGSSSPFRDELRTLLYTHLCTDEHFQMTSLRDYARQHGPICTFDGIGGDVLSRNNYASRPSLIERSRNEKWRGMAEEFCDGHHHHTNWTPEDEMDPAEANRRFNREAALDAIAKEISRFKEAPHPVTAFYFWNRTRREISLVNTAVLSPAHGLCPYLDHDFVAFCESLPLSATGDCKLHDVAMQKAYPQFANVPFHNQLSGIPKGGKNGFLKRLRTSSDAVVAMSKLKPGLAISEIGAQTRMSVDRARRHQNVYRLYMICLNQVRDARSAKHLLTTLNQLEGTSSRFDAMMLDRPARLAS